MIERKKREMDSLQEVTSYRFEGIATALSAIHTGGEQTGGTIKTFNREKIRCSDRKIQFMPIISGNGFRGILRDCGMYFMLKELNLLTQGEFLLDAASFDFLTSGGALSKEAGRGIDIDLERQIRELIPLASVFGGATGRHILQGKLQVGAWYPICKELRHLLPPQHLDHPDAQEPIYDSMEIHPGSRMDDKKKARWQVFLPPEQRELLSAPKTRTTKSGDEIAEKPGVAQQIRFAHETIIAGSHFSCWINLEEVTPLEFEAFCTALVQWRAKPMIGGRGSEGLGLVDLNFDRWMHISPHMTTDGTAVGMPLGQRYMEYLHDRRDDLMHLLKEIH
jgi:hypothetical protein